MRCNRKKRFYGKIQEYAVWGRGSCENSGDFFMYEVHIETVEYIWVNIEKLQECTPSAQSKSTRKECKKWHAV